MKVLITGAAGFIGSHLIEEMSRDSRFEVMGIDALLETTYSSKIKFDRFNFLRESGIKLEQLDLRTTKLDPFVEWADVIVHLAALPGLTLSWENFTLYSSCNLNATQNLLNACITANSIKKFLYISTSSVYGANAVGDEMTLTKPFSPYGVTKLASENLVTAFSSNFEIDIQILRYFSIFGPRQRPDMAYATFINNIMNGKPVPIYGNGEHIRSNTYISDCVDGTIAALLNWHSNEIYNISGAHKIKTIEALNIIANELNTAPRIQWLPERKGDQAKTEGDFSKATRDFNYFPKVAIEEGLRRQVAFSLNRNSQ